MPILGSANGFNGEVVSQAQATGNILPVREANTNERFILKVHENSWIFKYDQWLPELFKIIISPGVDGVSESGDTSIPRSRALSQGYTIIDNENNRLDPKFKAYLKKWKAQKGFAYKMFYVYPELWKGNVVWKCDSDLELAFLLDVKEKYMPVIDPRVIEEAIEDAKKSLARIKDASFRGKPNIYDERIKRAEEKLKKMEESRNPVKKSAAK